MLLASLIAVVLFVVSLWLHVAMIRGARSLLPSANPDRIRLTGSYLVILVSHLMVAALFAFGFELALGLDLGGFKKAASLNAMDLFYFSLINVTTVGIGDIYPIGHLRVIAGIESLTGFLIISCTAQFVYTTMQHEEK